MLAAIERSDDRLSRAFNVRRATVKRERANPPPMIKQVDFCGASEVRDRIPSGAGEP
jgi:hypothetical protein